MLQRLTSLSKLNWLIIAAVVLTWITASVFLLFYYGQPLHASIIESLTLTIWIFLSLLILENVFKYFSPKNHQKWLIVGLPLIISFGVVFFSKFLLGIFVPNNPDYLSFSEQLLPLKIFIVFIILLAWSLILIIYGQIEDQIEAKERLGKIQEMAKEAELYHLKQQLQPHFLFNSLNSVSALIKSNPEKAREMIFQLADFLRGTINKGNNKWIKVAEEKEYLDLFLAIEKVRFGHRLKTEFRISDDTEELKLPQLLIQPILENAIKHGLYGITGEVLIQIAFEKQGEFLTVMITNPFNQEAGKTKGSGFGLEAVSRRLFLIFGRNDLLKTTEEADTFKVKIKVPQIQ
ncbi:Autolysin sensor kinase [Indibacter alkaliphilus LW1]|jgi:two-component system LytT family sensor kinase|uniref:Autolysin sensor kinase n=1 Tax=Indibacter alkaliphilus (strain CCUG 57479 / KCTC 22604 / LW1) TaxID=1189612 RepID=S2DMN4_INDAL|nr:histidine kinase [Indibacter alkaliphilus]EPA00233.1 Autolysin sensor kinase [Indibacter alkaliphilus LW1]